MRYIHVHVQACSVQLYNVCIIIRKYLIFYTQIYNYIQLMYVYIYYYMYIHTYMCV